MRPAAVAAVLAAAAAVDVTRASATILMILAVSEMVLVIAIAVASVTCRPYYGLGHQSRKWSWLQVRRMIILCGQNIGQLLLFSVDFTSLRGLLQDHESDRRHGQGGQDGGRRRRLQHWFQIFTIRKFLEHILCVAVVNMQLLVKGRSNFRSGKKQTYS